jgi:hypothetical protein
MFITTIKYGEAPERLNIHALPLGGTLAHLMQRDELWRHLKGIGVPGIAPQSGHQELLVAYAKFLAANPADAPTDTRDDAA